MKQHAESTIDLKRLGEAIHTWRRKRGMTQRELAMTVGVTRQHLGEVERGIQKPSEGLKGRIADKLGITPQYLSRIERGDANASPELLYSIAEALGMPDEVLNVEGLTKLGRYMLRERIPQSVVQKGVCGRGWLWQLRRDPESNPTIQTMKGIRDAIAAWLKKDVPLGDLFEVGDVGVTDTKQVSALEPAYSFPLRDEFDSFCRSRWGWSIGEVAALEHRGAPIRRLPSETPHGERRYVVVAELDEWLTRGEDKESRPGYGASEVARKPSRSAILRRLRGEDLPEA